MPVTIRHDGGSGSGRLVLEWADVAAATGWDAVDAARIATRLREPELDTAAVLDVRVEVTGP